MNPIPFIIHPSAMSSELPPYSAATTAGAGVGGGHQRADTSPALQLHPPAQATYNRLAGAVQTCSIADMKHDYFRISVDPSTTSLPSPSYLLALTTDPATPLYRIDLPHDPAALGSIVVYPASVRASAPAAVAAARFTKSPKRFEPIASVCTCEPYKNASGASDPALIAPSPTAPDADDASITTTASSTHDQHHPSSILDDSTWRPLFRSGRKRAGKIVYEKYRAQIPIVTVPGLRASVRAFVWRTTAAATYFELSSEGLLEYEPGRTFESSVEGKGSGGAEEGAWRLVFARITMNAQGTYPDVLEIRRGGGVEFEMAVVVQVFAMLWDLKKGL